MTSSNVRHSRSLSSSMANLSAGFARSPRRFRSPLAPARGACTFRAAAFREASMKHGSWVVAIGLGLSALGCGGEPASTGVDVARARIVGGQVDDTDKAAVGLAVNILGNFSGHCSGTLISPNLVLTARHCVSLTSGGP